MHFQTTYLYLAISSISLSEYEVSEFLGLLIEKPRIDENHLLRSDMETHFAHREIIPHLKKRGSFCPP